MALFGKGGERNQKLALTLIGIAALGVVGYMYSDVILPTVSVRPDAVVEKPAPKRADMNVLNRADFKELRQFGDVPVKVLQTERSDPFKAL